MDKPEELYGRGRRPSPYRPRAGLPRADDELSESGAPNDDEQAQIDDVSLSDDDAQEDGFEADDDGHSVEEETAAQRRKRLAEEKRLQAEQKRDAKVAARQTGCVAVVRWTLKAGDNNKWFAKKTPATTKPIPSYMVRVDRDTLGRGVTLSNIFRLFGVDGACTKVGIIEDIRSGDVTCWVDTEEPWSVTPIAHDKGKIVFAIKSKWRPQETVIVDSDDDDNSTGPRPAAPRAKAPMDKDVERRKMGLEMALADKLQKMGDAWTSQGLPSIADWPQAALVLARKMAEAGDDSAHPYACPFELTAGDAYKLKETPPFPNRGAVESLLAGVPRPRRPPPPPPATPQPQTDALTATLQLILQQQTAREAREERERAQHQQLLAMLLSQGGDRAALTQLALGTPGGLGFGVAPGLATLLCGGGAHAPVSAAPVPGPNLGSGGLTPAPTRNLFPNNAAGSPIVAAPSPAAPTAFPAPARPLGLFDAAPAPATSPPGPPPPKACGSTLPGVADGVAAAATSPPQCRAVLGDATNTAPVAGSAARPTPATARPPRVGPETVTDEDAAALLIGISGTATPGPTTSPALLAPSPSPVAQRPVADAVDVESVSDDRPAALAPQRDVVHAVPPPSEVVDVDEEDVADEAPVPVYPALTDAARRALDKRMTKPEDVQEQDATEFVENTAYDSLKREVAPNVAEDLALFISDDYSLRHKTATPLNCLISGGFALPPEVHLSISGKLFAAKVFDNPVGQRVRASALERLGQIVFSPAAAYQSLVAALEEPAAAAAPVAAPRSKGATKPTKRVAAKPVAKKKKRIAPP